MPELILEGDIPSQEVVVVDSPLPLTIETIVSRVTWMIKNQEIPIVERAEEVGRTIEALVQEVNRDFIILGCFLYHTRLPEFAFWKHLGPYESFEDWCLLGGQGLTSTLVNEAIMYYLNWDKLRVFNIDAETVASQPLSVTKAAEIQRKLHEYQKGVRNYKTTSKDSPQQQEEHIKEEAERYREVFLNILSAPESVVIEQRNEDQGKQKQTELWVDDIRWDEDQTKLVFSAYMEIDPATGKLLSELLRGLHNVLKVKYRVHAKIKGEEALKGLLSVADMIEQQTGQIETFMDEEEYYYETEEGEDEEEIEDL